MKKYYSLALLMMLSHFGFSQNVNSLFNAAQSLVKDVKLEKSTRSQKLESSEKNPVDFTFTSSETDSKGKTEAKSYSSNWVFFDVSKIERKAEKKQMLIILETKDGINAISVSKNGQPDGYTDKISILVDNADESRDLEKALRELIPAGIKKWESSVNIPSDYASLTNFVQSKIKDFTAMGVSVNQKSTTDNIYKYRTSIHAERTEDKKSEQVDYSFAWGDLSESKLKVYIKKNVVGVEAETVDKIRYINTTENKDSKNENELLITTESPLEAKVLAMAIQKLIPLARKNQQEYLAKNTPKTLEALKLITDFQAGDLQYNQSIPSACMCQYNRTGVEKGKSKEEKLVFNLGDLTDFKLDIEKDLVKISAKTIGKLPFVEVYEKNERKFEEEFSFYLGDTEKARLLLAQLPALATKCKENAKAESFDWLSKKISNAGVDGINQKLEYLNPSDHNNWRLTVSETGGKKMKEEVYEFNVSDLDMLKTDYEVEKQNLGIRIKSKNNEKLIKRITDGKPTFTNEIMYLTISVEDAKKINATLQGIAGKSKTSK
ncbi:MAG: hypothetical protein ACRCVT_10620 [Leadbetterella sp.]